MRTRRVHCMGCGRGFVVPPRAGDYQCDRCWADEALPHHRTDLAYLRAERSLVKAGRPRAFVLG